jgi:hypothetical protein
MMRLERFGYRVEVLTHQRIRTPYLYQYQRSVINAMKVVEQASERYELSIEKLPSAL